VKRFLRSPWLWIVVAVLGVLFALQYLAPSGGYDGISAGQMDAYVNAGQVQEITLDGGDQTVKATLKDGVRPEGSEVTSHWLDGTQPQLEEEINKQIAAGHLEAANFDVKNSKPSLLASIITTLLPFVLIILLFLFLMNQVQGGGGRGVMQFAKSRAKLISKDMPKTTFGDVAGADEAVEELGEIKEFLQEPAKFQAVGAKIPKGVLLYGPPGTGKTLLARAVAGEAGVPFYSISGSDFVEMFVGVGASRVRDLFEQAKENAPAIVFIDEIDAVGRHRGAGLGGGHDEREQTLNQLLVEMDGFEANDGVILIAATNRPDVLDPALLRPGRFDRQIVVDSPDVRGREGILQVHLQKIPTASDVDVEVLARGTPGMSGADLANLVNEGALLAARKGHDKVYMADLEEAKDKVMLGAERKSMVLSENERRLTAYHEAGHAVIALRLPGLDPLHKVTIIPRGRALGITASLPEEDRHSYTRDFLLKDLVMFFGGRVAEEMIFGAEMVTTGAANDIERATSIARRMVTQFGMSDAVGMMAVGDSQQEVFLGRDIGQRRQVSEQTAQLVDGEVKRFLDEAYERARGILKEHEDLLEAIAQALLERETLDREEIDLLADGRPLPPLPPAPAPPSAPAVTAPAAAPPVRGGGMGELSPSLARTTAPPPAPAAEPDRVR
jgi:cell division protease FtsH